MAKVYKSKKEIVDDEIVEMLFAIPSEERETWFRVGSAIKTVWGTSGFAIFDEWSRMAKSGYDSKSQRSQWRSFKPGVHGIGTIVYLAKTHGYHGEGLSHKDIDVIKADSESNNLEIKDKELAKRARRETQHNPNTCLLYTSPSPRD